MLILFLVVCATNVQTSAFSENTIVCLGGLEVNIKLSVCDYWFIGWI